MLNFLATQVDFECIFFFDEYEKEFEDSSDVLSFMDGVHNSETRKIFLLTTNNTDNSVEQNVYITANFEGATSADEIKNALSNLMNVASQKVHSTRR